MNGTYNKGEMGCPKGSPGKLLRYDFYIFEIVKYTDYDIDTYRLIYTTALELLLPLTIPPEGQGCHEDHEDEGYDTDQELPFSLEETASLKTPGGTLGGKRRKRTQ